MKKFQAAPLAFVITIYAGSYIFGGIPFSLLVAWNAFVYSLITWLCYVFHINKKIFQFGQGALWIPFALMVSFDFEKIRYMKVFRTFW